MLSRSRTRRARTGKARINVDAEAWHGQPGGNPTRSIPAPNMRSPLPPCTPHLTIHTSLDAWQSLKPAVYQIHRASDNAIRLIVSSDSDGRTPYQVLRLAGTRCAFYEVYLTMVDFGRHYKAILHTHLCITSLLLRACWILLELASFATRFYRP